MADTPGDRPPIYPGIAAMRANFTNKSTNWLYLKKTLYEGSNRKKDHSLAAYRCQHSHYRIYLRSCKRHPQRGYDDKMGTVSTHRIFRSLAMERPLGPEETEAGQKSNVKREEPSCTMIK